MRSARSKFKARGRAGRGHRVAVDGRSNDDFIVGSNEYSLLEATADLIVAKKGDNRATASNA